MGGSLNSVVLLLLVNSVSGSRLALMHISLIVNISSSLIHLHVFQLLREIVFFRLYQKNKFSESKGNFRQTVIVAKGLFKLPNLHMLPKFAYTNNKTGQSITYRNLVLGTFDRLLIVF